MRVEQEVTSPIPLRKHLAHRLMRASGREVVEGSKDDDFASNGFHTSCLFATRWGNTWVRVTRRHANELEMNTTYLSTGRTRMRTPPTHHAAQGRANVLVHKLESLHINADTTTKGLKQLAMHLGTKKC